MAGAKRLTSLGIFVCGVALLSLVGYLFYLQQQAAAGWNSDGPDPGGTLILCGGGSIPDAVFDRFVSCAGGRSARVVVIPAYYPTAKEKRELIAEWRTVTLMAKNVGGNGKGGAVGGFQLPLMEVADAQAFEVGKSYTLSIAAK